MSVHETPSLFDLRGRGAFASPNRDERDEIPPPDDDGVRRVANTDSNARTGYDPADGPTRRRSISVEELLDGLNPNQRDAVAHEQGPLLIVAGAGSGKTRVLTNRIAHLISARGVSPFQILAITFTNKAAQEMRERVGRLIGPVAERMWVSTFHSACVRILRRDAYRLGYRNAFTIYDQADAVRLVQFILRDLNVDPKRFPPRTVHGAISAAKNDLRGPIDYATSAANIYERRIAEVYAEYQRRLLAANAMDFDDLLLQAVALLESDPEVLAHYRNRFRHVLVDEYQDTNAAQNRFVILLAGEHRNVTVVGDGDQSIYRFRGADVRNILEFETEFPDATTIVLDQNYRSTQTILDAANAVIANNLSRTKKNLWTAAGAGDIIIRYHAEDERDEAGWIASEMARLHAVHGTHWGEMAIFYRTNAQSRVLEEYMVRVGVPYKVIGGTKFYDRKEIKDLLAYLRVLINPNDEISLKRILNVPRRGVGDTSVGRLDMWSRSNGRAFHEALSMADAAGITGKALKGVRDFLSVLDSVRETNGGPGAVLQAVLDRTGYVAELEAEGGVESAGRLENISELMGQAKQFETLEEFLETVSLVADTEEVDPDVSQATLMTLHTAKGLEFPVVFLLGMEDGVFPHIRSLGEPEELEEERRLAYVGITRARERLYLTHTWARMLFGSTQYNPMSRFIGEIPDELIQVKGDRARGGQMSGSGRSWQERDERGRRSQLWDRGAGRFGPGGAGGPGSANRSDDNSDGGGWGDPDDEPTGRAYGSGGAMSRADQHREDVVEAALRSGRAAKRGDAPPSATTGAEELGLAKGDDVVHAKYGVGTITELLGTGDKTQAVVRFPGLGEKQFLLAWTPLKKA
jgi:DNA helicase II / ATP-dependent DNA helicase PcrA